MRAVAFNVFASVAIVMLSKTLYAVWPFPIMCTAVHLVLTSMYVSDAKQLDDVVDPTTIAHRLLAILLALSIALTNVSLKLNSIGIYELVKSLQLPMTLLMQSCFFA